MEKKMETTGIIWGLHRDYRDYMEESGKENGNTPIMENQMEKKMENEMETGIIMCYIRVI